jgi:hypothetical protein
LKKRFWKQMGFFLPKHFCIFFYNHYFQYGSPCMYPNQYETDRQTDRVLIVSFFPVDHWGYDRSIRSGTVPIIGSPGN